LVIVPLKSSVASKASVDLAIGKSKTFKLEARCHHCRGGKIRSNSSDPVLAEGDVAGPSVPRPGETDLVKAKGFPVRAMVVKPRGETRQQRAKVSIAALAWAHQRALFLPSALPRLATGRWGSPCHAVSPIPAA
jgi:hypothetical protein